MHGSIKHKLGEHINEPLPKRRRQTTNPKNQRKPMQTIDVNKDISVGEGMTMRSQTSALNVTTKMNDENQNYANAPSPDSEKKRKQCNMCKNTENNCVDLSTNHATALNFSEIVRLPSWNIRQILTSICSRCLVYIGALTESCKSIRLRCEKALQDQDLPLALTPDTSSSSELLQVSIPSPDAGLSDSTSDAANILTTKPLSQTEETATQTSDLISRTPSPNCTNFGNDSMLEIHHEINLSPLNTESGSQRGGYQRLPTVSVEMKCKYCNRVYKFKRFFNKHVRCCALKSRSAKYLTIENGDKNHMETPNDKASERGFLPNILPPRKFHCNVCPITVDSIAKLWQHKRIHYKRYNCKICAKECTTLRDFDFHRAECTSKLEARTEMENDSESLQQKMPARRKTRSYSLAFSVACTSTTSSKKKANKNGDKDDAVSTITNYIQKHEELYTSSDQTSSTKYINHTKTSEDTEACSVACTSPTSSKKKDNEKRDNDDAVSTITNYVARHKELYTSPDQTSSTIYISHKKTSEDTEVCSVTCTSTTSSKKKANKNRDQEDAVSTITNYVQRHKELYTSPDQTSSTKYINHTKTSEDKDAFSVTCMAITSSKKKANNNRYKEKEDAVSTITNYVQRHKELYRKLSSDGSRLNYVPDSEDEDDVDKEGGYNGNISQADSLFSNRLLQTNEWVEIHSSVSSQMSQSDIHTSFNFLQCKTLKEYDLYLLERLKIEVKYSRITCFERNCDFNAFSLNDMMIHDYIDHYKKPRFYCRKCNHWFTSKIYLDYHLDVQDNGRYVCYKCACEFSRQSQLDLHLMQHGQRTDDIRKTKCLYCNLEFIDKEQFLEHCSKEKHSGKRKRKIIKMDRAMTIKNKMPKRRRSTYKSKTKYTIKEVINIHSETVISNRYSEPMISKRCTPMEKYEIQIPRRIGKVEFDYPWKPNCVGWS